jgi:uncharacterized protein (TIGR03067 family)
MFVLLVGLTGVVAGCGKKDKDGGRGGGGGGSSDADRTAVQGTWTIIKVEFPEGEKAPPEDFFKDIEITIKDNLITVPSPIDKTPGYAVFSNDASRSPREVDFTVSDEKGNSKPSKEFEGFDEKTNQPKFKEGPPRKGRGIYKIEGDTLMIAVGMSPKDGPRPAEFKPVAPKKGDKDEDGVVVVHLKKK